MGRWLLVVQPRRSGRSEHTGRRQKMPRVRARWPHELNIVFVQATNHNINDDDVNNDNDNNDNDDNNNNDNNNNNSNNNDNTDNICREPRRSREHHGHEHQHARNGRAIPCKHQHGSFRHGHRGGKHDDGRCQSRERRQRHD